jgi:hypothetical protein
MILVSKKHAQRGDACERIIDDTLYEINAVRLVSVETWNEVGGVGETNMGADLPGARQTAHFIARNGGGDGGRRAEKMRRGRNSICLYIHSKIKPHHDSIFHQYNQPHRLTSDQSKKAPPR